MEYALVIGPVAELVVIPGPMGMALVVVVITRPLVMALVILEPLVMAKPVVMALMTLEPLVMHLVVVVMAEPVVNALVLPPALVVVVQARYGLEQRKVPNQPVRYIVYATEWCCRHILQGNSSHLLWGCLSLYPRSLISRVAPLVHMHIGLGSVFPQITPLVGCTLALATSFVFPALPIGYSNKQRVILVIVSIGYGYAVDEVALL